MADLRIFIAIPFGCICLLVFRALRGEAEKARGSSRFYVVGFYRSVLLALGIVALMVGLSRVLAYFVP
ncbi:MAG TPA: hypothetical protein VK009_21550 [Chloroflexota bacterium]|nr:hypothetical protein [Chloroflexota bacterium]